MKLNAPIQNIMTAKPITIDVSTSLDKVESTLRNKHIRHLPVTKDGKLVGIVSMTDLKRISFMDNFGTNEWNADSAIYDMLTLDQVMVSKPLTVEASHTIKEVAEIFAEKQFHALPVLNGDDLVGIVTTTDLIKYLLGQFEEQA